MNTWFILFDGTFPNNPKFVRRTEDKKEAKAFYDRVRHNPTSTGRVMITTDDYTDYAGIKTNWDLL